MIQSMDQPSPEALEWLSDILAMPFTATKHIHSHQDAVYKIETGSTNYYLKISASLRSEHENLKKLATVLDVPKVIDLYESENDDYLLISEIPGKNLVELIGEWTELEIVSTFAEAVRKLHSLQTTTIFSEAKSNDVLLHGDMALPNIIISGQQISYIDFGQLTFGSPELDLADALWSLQRNISPDYGELFLEKYGPVVMTPEIEKALKFRYQPSDN